MNEDVYMAGENSDSSEHDRQEEEEEEEESWAYDSHLDMYNRELSRLLESMEGEEGSRARKDVYVGGRDEKGLPHGLGCIFYGETKIRYEGAWRNGVAEGGRRREGEAERDESHSRE
eukprot:768576-Hanusia_phi.AAC.11